MRTAKRNVALPIGRAARIAFELDTMRESCCQAAATLVAQKPLDEEELEECARLDDALAHAQRLLKSTVRRIMLSRIHRRTRAN